MQSVAHAAARTKRDSHLALGRTSRPATAIPAPPHTSTHTSLSASHRSRVDTLSPPEHSTPPSRRVHTSPRWTTILRAARSTCAFCRYTARFVNTAGATGLT